MATIEVLGWLREEAEAALQAERGPVAWVVTAPAHGRAGGLQRVVRQRETDGGLELTVAATMRPEEVRGR